VPTALDDGRRSPTDPPAADWRAAMLLSAVISDSTEEAIEPFTTREEPQAIVQAWDRDEPDQAGALRVEPVELETSPK
jgi:hypothetical protein